MAHAEPHKTGRPKAAPASAAPELNEPDTNEPAVNHLDTLFNEAGLVRSLRGGSGSVVRPHRFERAASEELAKPAPAPWVAANGVALLKVPAWQKMAWLWHGFATRKGGVSRAYCPEDGPGELNLGFTAEDAREAVMRNRALLAEVREVSLLEV